MCPLAPYDFMKMLQRPLSRSSKILVVDKSSKSYTRAIRLQTRPIPVEVIWTGTVEKPKMLVHLPDDVTDDEQEECLRIIRFMLSTTTDISEFVDRFYRDSVWKPIIEQFYGLRFILDANLFESMVKVIIGQQLNVQFAATLVERLVERAGETVEWKGYQLPVFPSATQVANWSYEQLRELSFSQRKAEYVIDFARAIVNGEVNLDLLQELSDDEIEHILTRFRGIGRWTVECFLLFGMGRPDVFPAADIGVQNALKQIYRLEYRPGESQVREMAAAWSPWRSYTTYYLWNSLIKDTKYSS